jgi:hypothetical protein
MEHTKQKAGRLSIRVRVKNGAGRLEAVSSTHDIARRADGDDLLLEYEAENVAPDQDFLLHLRPQADDEREVTLARFGEADSQYVFARWRPRLRGAVQTRPRQWFLINDVSASRSGVDVKAQAYVIERLLAEADDGDAFALINLDTQARPWKNELTGVRDPEGVSVAGFASVAERMGATNLKAALAVVSEMIDRTGADNAHIVYLGDGIATDGETQTKQLVSALPADAVFIGLGVGKKVDARFLQAAADATGGLFAALHPNEDLRWRVFDLVAALNTPRLVAAHVTFQDADGKPMDVQAHCSSRTLSDGEALTVLARTGKVLPKRMVVYGESGGKTFLKDYSLDEARPEAAYIPRLWAAARINHLLREGADAHKAEIVALSKAYYVVTPFTSLIVLERPGRHPRRAGQGQARAPQDDRGDRRERSVPRPRAAVRLLPAPIPAGGAVPPPGPAVGAAAGRGVRGRHAASPPPLGR